MLGVLELNESFDSCITATLTLCRSKNSPNSVSLLSMPFALNCMMVNEFPSTACVVIDSGSGCGFGRVGGWVCGELQELHTQHPIFVCTPLRFEDQNTLNVPIQNNDCIHSLPHTGHGYFVVGPEFGCTSPESMMHSHDREESEDRCGFDE